MQKIEVYSMDFEIFTLSNGLQVVHQQRKGWAAHAGFLINAGTRDEPQEREGLAHYLEHCLFKGTQKRKSFHILNRLDAVGGEINAFTTKEDTFIHASFLPKHYNRAIDLLVDITFRPSFPKKEVEREKDVVIDEIASYLDSPSDQIYDDFEDELFKEHPLGRNVLGTSESLKATSVDDLKEFHKNYYHPSNMVFSSVGDISAKRLKKLLEKHLEGFTSQANQERVQRVPQMRLTNLKLEKNVHQAHVMIGSQAFHYTDKKRRAFVLLNNILGGPSLNNRLNLNISEKYGFAYQIESNYTAFSDAGIFSVYMGTDAKHLDKANALVLKELDKLRLKKLGTLQLHQAKEQLKGQFALSQESGSSQMMALGKSLNAFGYISSLETIFSEIDALTAEQLLEVANEVFDPTLLSSLIFTPKE